MEIACDVREDFPLLTSKKSLIYLDSAATTHKPASVIEAMKTFYQDRYGTVHRGVYSLARDASEAYHGVRKKVQTFLNAQKAEEIIFTRGATASLNLVARSFGEAFLKEGDSILVPEIEHHSNFVPWQMACKRHGAHLRKIPVNDRGEILFEDFERQLNQKVKLVSLAHVSNVIGNLHPIEKIIEAAHHVGAAVCVDGAQAAGHFSIDVQKLDVDFYAFSAHKIYGPTGIGILYGKERLLEQMPPVEGGGDMIEHVSWNETTVQSLPLKFEAGTPMIAEAIGLGAAIDYLFEISLEVIHEQESRLLQRMTSQLETIEGLRILGTQGSKGPIVSFLIDGIHPLDLATLLDCKEIAIRTGHQCSQLAMERFGISSVSRASLGIYNDLEEIDRFAQSLREILYLLR